MAINFRQFQPVVKIKKKSHWPAENYRGDMYKIIYYVSEWLLISMPHLPHMGGWEEQGVAIPRDQAFV